MLCSSYRPISILNQDYKLYSSIISKRLDSFIPDLIDNDQTGFVRGCQTQDNIRRSLHIIHNIRESKMGAALISLDAEKAFDCVSWEYLFLVLERFGFTKNSIDIFRTLYSAPTARVKINGRLTNRINLERSTRQGCPLSPTLFALYIEPLAQAIRENDDIHGIDVNGKEHKIALYADDILLYVADPDRSLHALLDLLETFGNLSGYKLNIQKTQILVFNYRPSVDLEQRLTIDWSQKAIKYLGVWLTHCPKDLYKRNYEEVSKKIKEDLNHWSTFLISFSSRIETIKMVVMPKLLYLFMSLPVKIPICQFNEWNKQISRFIWNGKKPRIRFNTLTIDKARGGMSLPNLRDYYLAAQIKPVILWCDSGYDAGWKEMERKCGDIPIQAMIGDRKLATTHQEDLNPLVSFTLSIWFDVIKQLNLSTQIKKLRWVAYDTDFVPNSMDSRFKFWMNRGITAFCRLIQNNRLHSFQTIREKYNLEKQDFFRYLQLRQYFLKEMGKKEANTVPNDIIQLITQTYTIGSKSVISRLYQGIVKGRGSSTNYIREKWEKEIKERISPQQWENICENMSSTTCSSYWREFCWKNLVRFFITPKLKSHQTSLTHTCWRGCGEVDANHYHIFWACPKIDKFWENVWETIQQILDLQIPGSCLSLYLGDMPEELTRNDKYLLKIFTAAAKKAITRKWLQTDSPTVDNWLDIIKEIHEMERLTFLLRLRNDLYIGRWTKWNLYMFK